MFEKPAEFAIALAVVFVCGAWFTAVVYLAWNRGSR